MTTDLLTRPAETDQVAAEPERARESSLACAPPMSFSDLLAGISVEEPPVLEPTRSVNEPFLRLVLAYIQQHPERWDQSNWATQTSCGTAYCLAGWAYTLTTGKRFDEAGVPDSLVRVAQSRLGLNSDQAEALFYFTRVRKRRVTSLGRTRFITRHPTFEEFCKRVEEVTGVTYRPALVATAA